jgi:hypothetical protein
MCSCERTAVIFTVFFFFSQEFIRDFATKVGFMPGFAMVNAHLHKYNLCCAAFARIVFILYASLYISMYLHTKQTQNLDSPFSIEIARSKPKRKAHNQLSACSNQK